MIVSATSTTTIIELSQCAPSASVAAAAFLEHLDQLVR
jgi:hypothetical protein